MIALRTTVAAGVLALALAAPAGADELEHTTLALPATAFIFSSAYIAQDAGIFKDVGLDVKEEVIQGIGSTNAVIAGSMDFAMASGVTLARAAARHQPVIGIAETYNRSGFWLILSKKIADERHFDPNAPLAERAKLMKGLRISIGPVQSIPHAYVNVIAKAGGLDPQKDFTEAVVMATDDVPSMVSGAIDGFSGGPPVVEEAVLKNEGVILANGTTGTTVDPPWLAHIAANVVLTQPQTCQKHRSLCVKMGEAMTRANEFMHQHPDEAMALLGKRLNVTDPKILAAAYKDDLYATPMSAKLDAEGLANADRLNVEAGFMKPEDKLSSYDGVFTNDYVK
jgi:NitT/TauT family transport system substrate-binding protein